MLTAEPYAVSDGLRRERLNTRRRSGGLCQRCANYLVNVRHARGDALDDLDDVLSELRALPGLVEKTRGVFYKRSRAFLHFHEDPAGLYADVRLGKDFARHRVQTKGERRRLLSLVTGALKEL